MCQGPWQLHAQQLMNKQAKLQVHQRAVHRCIQLTINMLCTYPAAQPLMVQVPFEQPTLVT
jgi:hypothetical protein